MTTTERMWQNCRVYWGSHGCRLYRGHEGLCECCCICADHERDHDDEGCVGLAPYYGEITRFYGEDVAGRGLPLIP